MVVIPLMGESLRSIGCRRADICPRKNGRPKIESCQCRIVGANIATAQQGWGGLACTFTFAQKFFLLSLVA